MTEMTQHPTSEQLDRFRADLLDQETSALLSTHIRHCTQCQKALAGWTRLQTEAEASLPNNKRVAADLQMARNEALSTTVRSRRGFLQPVMAMAASVTLIASLVLWQPWSPLGTNPDKIDPNQMAQLQEEKAPDIYEDLDFYLWLAGEQESAISLPNDTTVKT